MHLALERRRERYIIIYIWKITQHMVPNIDGTMGRKIKTRKHPRHGTQCVILYPTNRNPAQSLQENSITVFGPRLYNSLPKYLRDIESVKTEKFKFEPDKFLELIPVEQKMPNCVTASGSNWILNQLTHLMAQGIYRSGGVPTRPRSSLSCFETTPSIQVPTLPWPRRPALELTEQKRWEPELWPSGLGREMDCGRSVTQLYLQPNILFRVCRWLKISSSASMTTHSMAISIDKVMDAAN